MQLTSSEEDYIMAIYRIFERTGQAVNTNAISAMMKTTPASVTDMIRRLSEKGIINYEKYKGVTLKQKGNSLATQLIRRNRLWKVFLSQKLNFSWDEIQEASDILEHVNSVKMIDELDKFLSYPKYDPHGDPIPDKNGKFVLRSRFPLSEVSANISTVVVGLLNQSPSFLTYLDGQKISLGSKIKILERFEFDRSFSIILDEKTKSNISIEIAKNILVRYYNKQDAL
jgi:DtxR family transcriptional regulator, Mn-dependent transcriptional regulator